MNEAGWLTFFGGMLAIYAVAVLVRISNRLDDIVAILRERHQNSN